MSVLNETISAIPRRVRLLQKALERGEMVVALQEVEYLKQCIRSVASKLQPDAGQGGALSVTSLVSAANRQPYVLIEWPADQSGCQVTGDEAVQIAMHLLEAVSASIGDAFLASFMTDKLKLDDQRMAQLLGEFRAYRAGVTPNDPADQDRGPVEGEL